MTPWRTQAPTRKLIRGGNMAELTKRIEQAAYGWQVISEVVSRNGRFEVLVEVRK